MRWARLRRATFPLEFLPEILSGTLIPALTAAAAAAALDWPVAATTLAYLGNWYAAEIAVAAACRWPVGLATLPALVVRDVMMPAVWVGAFTGRSFTWKGTAMQMESRRRPIAAETEGA